MLRQRRFIRGWVVLCLGLSLLVLSVASFGQEGQDSPGQGSEGDASRQPVTPSLVCPQGMVLIPSTPSVLGPSGKPLEAFCIDTFEYPNIPGSLPSYNVTWIEAESLCFKEGKRLCSPQEWRAACSSPLGFLYPYGNAYQPETCNTEGEWMMNGSRTVHSGAFPGCMSGYGVVDMSGNVSEWTASEGDAATIHGGSFVSGRFSSCKSFYSLSKTQKYIFNGLRCCTGPTAIETDSQP